MFQHLINLVARLFFFLTKGSYVSKFEFGYEDRSAVVSLPGTRFAELLCTRDGYRPIRFHVGRLDASTMVNRIDADGIDLQVEDVKWTSSISTFLKHLHFSR